MDEEKIDHTCIRLGRGPANYDSPGNERFRVIVEAHLPLYMTSTKAQKTQLLCTVIKKMSDEGLKFIVRGKKDGWEIVTDEMYIKSKVGHRFRDLIREKQRAERFEPIPISGARSNPLETDSQEHSSAESSFTPEDTSFLITSVFDHPHAYQNVSPAPTSANNIPHQFFTSFQRRSFSDPSYLRSATSHNDLQAQLSHREGVIDGTRILSFNNSLASEDHNLLAAFPESVSLLFGRGERFRIHSHIPETNNALSLRSLIYSRLLTATNHGAHLPLLLSHQPQSIQSSNHYRLPHIPLPLGRGRDRDETTTPRSTDFTHRGFAMSAQNDVSRLVPPERGINISSILPAASNESDSNGRSAETSFPFV